jgi:hypothetical protein
MAGKPASARVVEENLWKEADPEFPTQQYMNIAKFVRWGVEHKNTDVFKAIRERYGVILARDKSLVEYLDQICKRQTGKGIKA